MALIDKSNSTYRYLDNQNSPNVLRNLPATNQILSRLYEVFRIHLSI